ncbi:armadillo-type protein [Piptocephalis cylindrospora]|uniref:Armadillo-type protein n=1 Tax=Piptocephalis cylindrospora TaxID=1907219 RepID=A0A4P9Y568_9FUNG|nr:armadillo-type protein [Piptocephalis cylindrospora]|eukprot:RKP14073.1 armadillo-type protein [Piptocephalis cylindrospora]
MQVVSQDVVRRHAFPLVTPEDLLSDKCILHRGHTYIHPGSTIGRGVHLGQGVMVGDGAIIEDGVRLVQSIIGPGCIIEKDAQILRSHLWSGVRVGTGAKVEESILADGVELGEGSMVQKGSILSYGVRVAKDMVLSPGLRLTTVSRRKDTEWDEEEDEEDSVEEDMNQWDIPVVGSTGKGRVWGGYGMGRRGMSSDETGLETAAAGPSDASDFNEDTESGEDDDDEEEEEDEEDPRNRAISDLGFNLRQLQLEEGETTGSESSEEEEEEDEDNDDEAWGSPMGLADGVDGLQKIQGLDNIEQPKEGGKESEEFVRELRQTLDRAFKEDHEVEVAALEINTLRMTFNGQYRVIRREVTDALLTLTLPVGQEGGAGRGIRPVLTKWSGLLTRMTHESADQVNLILATQEFYARHPQHLSAFKNVLHQLYEQDVLDEEQVLRWWYSSKSTEVSGPVRQSAIAFITWLEEADEESEDDEESDEE